MSYVVVVWVMCEFIVWCGDFDLCFMFVLIVFEGIVGYGVVMLKCGVCYEIEIVLIGMWGMFIVCGCVDGYDFVVNWFEEIKIYCGSFDVMLVNYCVLYWVQVKVYVYLMCVVCDFVEIDVVFVYFDIVFECEIVLMEMFDVVMFVMFFVEQCVCFVGWVECEMVYCVVCDVVLCVFVFLYGQFCSGQCELVVVVYCVVCDEQCLMV